MSVALLKKGIFCIICDNDLNDVLLINNFSSLVKNIGISNIVNSILSQ